MTQNNYPVYCSKGSDSNSVLHNECHDAILNLKFRSDDLFFYANLAAAVLRAVAYFVFDYFHVILLSVAVIVFLRSLYKSTLSPFSYRKELSEVGYEHIPAGPDRDKWIARAQAARKLGPKLPPPYPNGWFAVAESRELKRGGVQQADVLGQNICVYRGADGVARCVDAYCPHLGANMAIGGTVCGNCIQCPFHKWTFDESGACYSVPGQDNPPKGVSVRSWTTVEAEGAVWIWYDAEKREPQWEFKDAQECKKWGYRGRNEFIVNSHIQEIPENASDVAHLNVVHTTSLLSEIGERFPFLHPFIGQHVWSATWQNNGDHTATMTLKHDYKIHKYKFGHMDINITQTGPGHVQLLLTTPIGPFYFSQSVTPIAPMLQRVVHRLFSPLYNSPFNYLLMMGEGFMFERDIRVWNSKLFVGAPAYVKADKTIRAFRNWYSQFYSEHSTSMREAISNPLDW